VLTKVSTSEIGAKIEDPDQETIAFLGARVFVSPTSPWWAHTRSGWRPTQTGPVTLCTSASQAFLKSIAHARAALPQLAEVMVVVVVVTNLQLRL
jgi:hypothetical protein